MIKKEIEIINKLGLHARAAAKFVRTASQFNSNIEVEKNQRKVNGKSILGVMLLAAATGDQIMLFIEGDDEQHALEAIEQLINDRFHEEE